MANKQRGEVAVKLGKSEYTMRPTFEALCEIEDRLGMNLPSIVQDLQMGNISLKKVATIIWAGIHGNQDGEFSISPDPTIASSPTLSEVGNMIRDSGFTNLVGDGIREGVNPIVNFLARGILGDAEVDEQEATQEKARKKIREEKDRKAAEEAGDSDSGKAGKETAKEEAA